MWTGCGISHKVKGETTHTVHTESKAEIEIKIDISGCMKLPPEDRLNCVTQMTDAIKELTNAAQILICIGDTSTVSGGQGVDTAKSCWPASAAPK
jgi:glycerate kinase